MSILCETELGVVISHETFINKIYQNVLNREGKGSVVRINSSLFNINLPFVNSKNKSRKRRLNTTSCESSVLSAEIEKVKTSLPVVLAEARKLGYFIENTSSCEELKSNDEARKAADKFYQESLNWQGKLFHGGNNSETAITKCIANEDYLFPSHCTFHSYNVLDIEKKLDIEESNYDFILLDPPWWNKYIRRKKAKCVEGSYQMMYNEDLKKIPIGSLLAPGSLIAVWCTNSPTHLNTLISDIFPAWGVRYVGKWFWIKVSRFGEPVCSFSDPPGKQPFEQIIFGCKSSSSRKYPLPEDGKLIVSVPSAIHSHKPPLCDLLSPYLGPKPQCLELFARYLLPNWTSWGYEVLKLQQMSLYHCFSNEEDRSDHVM